MDITSILKRSWQLTKQHRFLWWLGILAAFTQGGSMSVPSNTGSWKTNGTNPPINDATIQHVATWIQGHIGLLVSIGAVLFVLWLVMMYVSFAANAGLILAVDDLESSAKNRRTSFGAAFHAGRAFVWRQLGFMIVTAAIIFAAGVGLAIIAIPLIGLSVAWPPFLILSIPLGLAALVGFIVFVVYMSLVISMGQRQIVLGSDQVMNALHSAHTLVRSQLRRIGLLWLVDVGVTILVSGILAVVVIMIVGILVGIGFGIYAIAHTTGTIIYGVLAGLVLLAACMVFGGAWTAFRSSYWTLSYRAVTHLAKN